MIVNNRKNASRYFAKMHYDVKYDDPVTAGGEKKSRKHPLPSFSLFLRHVVYVSQRTGYDKQNNQILFGIRFYIGQV